MRSFMHIKKLDQRGFDHVLVALAFAVIVALGGTYWLIQSHANAWSGSLKLGLDQSFCMENRGNSSAAYAPVQINKCNTSSQAQLWSIKAVGNNFQIVAAASGACVDDTRGQVQTATGAANRVFVQTWPCNTADNAQLWHWGGTGNHQLISVASKGCINDPANSKTSGTQLVVYTCAHTLSGKTMNGDASNAQWIEGSNSGSGSGPVAPPVTNTGEIYTLSHMCVTAGTTITLKTCVGTANQKWGQVESTGTGSTSFFNAASNAYLGTSSTSAGGKVIPTSNPGNAVWIANDAGDGLDLLMAGVNSGDACLQANGSSLTLAACDSNNINNQAFSIPGPVSSADTGGDSGTTPPSDGSGDGSDQGSGSSTSTADITTLLQALQSADPSFDCGALTAANQAACRQVFGQ